jgi:hypothetical protein
MKRLCAAAVLTSLALASPAFADGPAHDKAVESFEAARRLVEAGNCDGAVLKLQESLRLEPLVGAHLSYADCIQKTDPLGAWRHLKEAARIAYLKKDTERFVVAEKRAGELEPTLTKIRVQIPPDVLEEPGFELRLDGALVDRFYYRDGVLVTSPGRHVVEAYAPRRKFAQSVDAEAGLTAPVAVALQLEQCQAPAAQPAAAAAPDAEPRGSGQRAAGLVLGGVGVAGLALGTVMGLVTLAKKSELDAACGGNVEACIGSPPNLEAQRESAKNTATLSTASFVVGGFALVGGAVLFLTAPKAAPVVGGPVRLAPTAGKNEGGVVVVGRW